MKKLNLMALTILSCISFNAIADSAGYNNATDAGQSLGALLANQGSTIASSGSGDNVLDALGTNVTATGSESSMQKSNMGAEGTLSSSFNFEVKPSCTDTGYYPLLHGSYIKIPCSSARGLIAASVCINDENNSVDCNLSTSYKPINLPTNGNTVTDYGYQFTGKCDASGNCNGKMTENAQVSTNADNINQQSIDTAKKSGLYDMISSGYVGKDGYSKQQAYMKSFGDGGSNNIFAKCTNDISGILQNGTYYSCDHKESDSFNGHCTTQKICTNWELIHHDTVTNKSCTLTSGSKDIQCQKIVKVEIKTKVIPPKDIPFSDESHDFIRGNAWNGELYFNLPYDGILKSFHIVFHGDFKGQLYSQLHYNIYIHPVSNTEYHWYRDNGYPIHFDFNTISSSVKKGRTGHISIYGINYAGLPDFYVTYNGVIEIPQKIEKYAVTSTAIQC